MRLAPFVNVDLGELLDEDDALYTLAHVANVACGGHAGDAASMGRAVERCAAGGCHLGAHPSFPDRAGFGRRPLAIDAPSLRRSVDEQCRALAQIARARGATVRFAKAHGALYHDADADPARGQALLLGIRDALGIDVTIIGPATGRLREAAITAGFRYAREGFADRGTRADGSLLPRTEPGAQITDPRAAAAAARRMAQSGGVDTVCVHGDTPGAVEIARAVREALSDADS